MVMMICALILVVGVCTFARALSYDSSHAGYDQWASLFRRERHPNHRQFSVWLENNAYVNSVNSDKSSKWSAEMNKFGDLTAEEFKNQVLMKRPLNTESEHHTTTTAAKRLSVEREGTKKTADGVATYDWRNVGGVTAVQDQGYVGTCWSFSTVANIEGQHYMATNQTVKLSEEFFVDCDGTADETLKHADCSIYGGWPYLAYQFAIQKGGVPSEESYPYCAGTGECMPCMQGPESLCGPPPYSCDRTIYEDKCMEGKYDISATISDWGAISTDESEMASQLMSVGPLSALLDASGLQFYKEGVWQGAMDPDRKVGQCSKTYLNHAITLTGFGTDPDTGLDYWSVKNSWGEGWGEDGYFRIQRGEGECGINNAVTTAVVG